MSNDAILEGKVIVVTGAGRGIGREIALIAASEGAKVVVNDLGGAVSGEGQDEGPAQEVVSAIRKAGGQAVASTDSVADWDSARRIIDLAVNTFGTIDVVVNNAGILRDKMFHQMSVEDWDAVVKVHLYGAFYMSRAAAPFFRSQEHGAYVHMTSTAGLIGGMGQGNYAAAKLGIVGLSRSIAGDMARFNVRSNCIAPHAMSRMIETVPGRTPEQLELRRQRQRPDQVAKLAVFLASDAAKEINAQIIGARGNEFYLYSQHRPVRTLQRGDGWTPRTIAEQMIPAWKSSFVPMERTGQIFSWDPI